MNYLGMRLKARFLKLERSTPRVIALRAPEALWPLTLGFSLFALWILMGSV